MSLLSDVELKNEKEAIALFSHEDLRSSSLSLTICVAVEVTSLQLYPNHLQEKGMLSIDGSFDYSSIDESVFRNFINDPTAIFQISSEMKTTHIPKHSREYSLKDFLIGSKLESRVSNSSDLNSDSPSL